MSELRYLQEALREARCVECHAEGSLYVAMMTFQVGCRNCQAKGIDPFALGPWHNKLIVKDTLEGEQIALYAIDEELQTEAPFNPNFGNLIRLELGLPVREENEFESQPTDN